MSVLGEVKSLREYCTQAGFRNEEIREIWRPLYDRVQGEKRKRKIVILVGILVLVAAVFIVSSIERVQWHASAVGRITLIKFSPVFDWTVFFRKQCLVDKNELADVNGNFVNFTDCDFCELGALSKTDHISNTSYDDITNRYLIKSIPVVVRDARRDWIDAKISDVNVTHLLLNNEVLQDSNPCLFKTNLRLGQNADLKTILAKLANNKISDWFFHFQNCDLQTVKILRVFVPRPYFLSPHVPPAHYNWLLMSNEYETSIYKTLELDAGLVIMSQLMGSNRVQISPKYGCESFCPTKSVLLNEGDTLVVSNSVWNLAYIPSKDTLNVAILTETDWNDI